MLLVLVAIHIWLAEEIYRKCLCSCADENASKGQHGLFKKGFWKPCNFIYECVHAYMHTCIQASTHTHTQASRHTHARTYAHTYAHMRTHNACTQAHNARAHAHRHRHAPARGRMDRGRQADKREEEPSSGLNGEK